MWNKFSRKKLIFVFFGLLAILLSVHFFVKHSMNRMIEEQVQSFVRAHPFIKQMDFQSNNAGLLALTQQTYTLYHVSITFNNPHFNETMRIKSLTLRQPQFNAEQQLIEAEIEFQGMNVRPYIQKIDERTSLPLALIKTMIQPERPLLMNGQFKWNLSDETLGLHIVLKQGMDTLFSYQAALKNFKIFSTAPDGLYLAFQQTQTESSLAELNISGNFLDPKLTTPLPIIQVVAKEMGYYSLKGEVHISNHFQEQDHAHHTKLTLELNEAVHLTVNASLLQDSSITSPKALLSSWKGLKVAAADFKLRNLGLIQRLFPVLKVYFNMGKSETLTSLESLQQAQTSEPLKKAIQDVIAFVRAPSELVVTLEPAQPFDPVTVILELKEKNKHNFEQYQQEMAGVMNDETRKKVTEFFSFKQDDSITQALTQIGFQTHHR